MYWIAAHKGADYALLPFEGTGRIGPRFPVNTGWGNPAPGTTIQEPIAGARGSTAPGAVVGGNTAPAEGGCLSRPASEEPEEDELGDWGTTSMVSESGSFVMIDSETDME